jgi:hypothetical protein
MTKKTTVAVHSDSELDAALKKIKALRRADPTFAKEFQAIAVAEIKHRKQDPIERAPVREEPAVTATAARRGAARESKQASMTVRPELFAGLRRSQ